MGVDCRLFPSAPFAVPPAIMLCALTIPKWRFHMGNPGSGGACHHPEHDTDLALHTSLTTVDLRELIFLAADGAGSTCFNPGGGAGGACFHPEHEVDLALHRSLTAIDALELEGCR
jgi:hypothetical protein